MLIAQIPTVSLRSPKKMAWLFRDFFLKISNFQNWHKRLKWVIQNKKQKTNRKSKIGVRIYLTQVFTSIARNLSINAVDCNPDFIISAPLHWCWANMYAIPFADTWEGFGFSNPNPKSWTLNFDVNSNFFFRPDFGFRFKFFSRNRIFSRFWHSQRV